MMGVLKSLRKKAVIVYRKMHFQNFTEEAEEIQNSLTATTL